MPQGSVLGPLLFNFYIADIEKICQTEHVKLKFFADDLKAYLIYAQQSETLFLQAFIQKFSDWCKLNDLKISVEKCKVLYFGKKSPRTPYFMNDALICIADDNIRDLGVLLTPDLKFSTHIDHICKSARARLFTLFKAVRSTDQVFLNRMYTTYVRPILEFSSSVFNPYLKTDIKKLEKVQITAMKLIHYRNSRGQEFSYNEILAKLGLKTLQERRLIADLMLYHKIHHNKVRIDFRNKPQITYPRNRIKIITGTAKTNTRFHSFFVRLPRTYCKLPTELISNPSVFSFKNALNNMDLSKFL